MDATVVSNKKLYTLSEFNELLLTNLIVPKFMGNKYAVLAMFFSIFMLDLIGLFLYYYSTTATILIPVVICISVLYYHLYFKSWFYVKIVSYSYAFVEVIIKPRWLKFKKTKAYFFLVVSIERLVAIVFVCVLLWILYEISFW